MNIFHKAKIYQTASLACEVKQSMAFSTQVLSSIGRFCRQDWGEISEEDKAVNADALKYKDFLLGYYETCQGETWITAESTDKIEYDIITVMFPSDY